MRNYDSHPNLTNCTFSENSAMSGGGMSNRNYSDPTVTNCTFNDNSAAKYGGGMRNNSSSPTVTNCTFSGNSANGGGGMRNNSSSPSVTNCTFIGNSGGMHNRSDSYPNLTNCTFNQNSAAKKGGGMRNSYQSDATLENCILWDDNASDEPEISSTNNSSAWVSYSDVQGGWPGLGNIDTYPLFALPGYWDDNNTPGDPNDDIWLNGDYHLMSESGRWDSESQSWVKDDVTSPCIDAGDPNSCLGYHEPYPNGLVINMGAYGGTDQASMSLSPAKCNDDWWIYDDWEKVGKPTCWCYPRHCHGDTDCKAQGKNKYWVSTNDLDVLLGAWHKTFEEIEGQEVNGVPLICADFNHMPQGKQKFRVSINDLDILIANWNQANAPAADCP
jgi:hypothetical protein